MTTSLAIGIDVVDLRGESTAWHPRFPRRVLTDREFAHWVAGGSTSRDLWSLWAAKEAAFKAISRPLHIERFHPEDFHVNDSVVHWRDLSIRVSHHATDDYIVAIASLNSPETIRWAIGPAGHDERLAARQLARQLARPRTTRPTTSNARPLGPFDRGVSLSHHGRFATAAIID